ncbi:DUF6088 family protein [Janthinobacterium fluminis]|uniref:DUF6088 family protein n=1 Tax=Janthinobacterium fluminis TaxID=2987524 RepID=UPI002358396A|nr:DUF6088 family protein [Janthinobacterium fluminis]
MDIQGRILQSIRPRKDGLLLRSDVSAMGSSSQVSAALAELGRKGLILRIERGVYVTPQKLELLGKQVVLANAHQRQSKLRQTLATHRRRKARVLTPTARYVASLAKRLGISYTPTYSDRWAIAVTRLAGDEVSSDTTDDLLVALTRAGKLSPTDMAKLVMEHHRILKSHV